jgi:Leucine-rich repeat (LRR) protein
MTAASLMKGIKGLSNLTALELDGNELITDDGLKWLGKKLTSLSIQANYASITDEGIKLLTNLTFLDVTECGAITDDVANSLPNLIRCEIENYTIL